MVGGELGKESVIEYVLMVVDALKHDIFYLLHQSWEIRLFIVDHPLFAKVFLMVFYFESVLPRNFSCQCLKEFQPRILLLCRPNFAVF
jgi:hypothetical protein